MFVSNLFPRFTIESVIALKPFKLSVNALIEPSPAAAALPNPQIDPTDFLIAAT